MAASQASLELRNNTNANFRLWGAFISNGLLAGGWTLKYTDIDWTNVNAPAQNAYAGTEVWESPAETGLTKFYLLTQYGSNNNATFGPAINYQLGWGWTSGAALTGVVSTAATSLGGTTAASPTARVCSIAAGAGYFIINLGNNTASPCQHLLTVARTRDEALNKQDVLLHCFGHQPNTTPVLNSRVLDTNFEYPLSQTSSGSVATHSQAFISTIIGQGIQYGKIGKSFLTGFKGERTSPLETFIAVPVGSMGSAGQIIQLPIYGVDRSWMIGNAAANNPGAWAINEGASYSPLYLYE
jgi:hypothetical protein